MEYLVAVCFAVALICGLLSYGYSHVLRTPTPAYRQFEQSLRAQAATRPAGIAFDHPPFPGQEYVPRPLLSLPTTYFALGFAGAGVALIVLSRRPRGRAG